MPLSRNEVERIARLARLHLSPSEIEKFSRELTVIVDYVSQLPAVETGGIEPENHTAATGDVFRKDEVSPSLRQNQALGNAPQTDGEYFLVPRVVG